MAKGDETPVATAKPARKRPGRKVDRVNPPAPRAGALPDARRREQMAYELFVNGASYSQIAETRDPQTGQPLYASRGSAESAVKRALAYRGPVEEAEMIRAQRLAGLQAQRLDCIRQLGQPHPLFDRAGRLQTRPVTRPDGKVEQVPYEDEQARMAIHRTLVQIDKQIAAISGTDAAMKMEVTGRGGGPVEMDVRVQALKERAANIRLLPRPPAIDVDSRVKEG